MAVQQIERVLLVPACVAKLEDRAVSHGDARDEFFQSRKVLVQVGWKLVENRPEVLAQQARQIEESLDLLGSVAELLDVGDVPAGLDREQKPRRHAVVPVHHRLLLRQVVESVVDLDRVEVLGVVLEPFVLAEFLRVEPADPVIVVPAGGADPDVAVAVAHGKTPLDLQFTIDDLLLYEAVREPKAGSGPIRPMSPIGPIPLLRLRLLRNRWIWDRNNSENGWW